MSEPKGRDTIPGEGKSVDGMSRVPGRRLERQTDWAALEREFLTNTDYPSAQTWLREVKGWPEAKIRNGWTLEKTTGWSKKRASIQQQITQEAIEELKEEERKRIPILMRAKLNLVTEIIREVGRWSSLQPGDKKLCYQILKVELGEPTDPTKLPPKEAKDPVEALLEEYGLMEDGAIIDAPRGDSRQAAETHSSS